MVKYKLTVDEPWGFNHNGSNILHGIVIKQLSPTFLLFKSDSFLDFNGQKSCIQFSYLQPIVTQYLVCNKSEIWP